MNAAPIYETEPTNQPEPQQQPERSWLDVHLIEVMFVAVVAAVLAGLAWVGVSAQRISSAMRAK